MVAMLKVLATFLFLGGGVALSFCSGYDQGARASQDYVRAQFITYYSEKDNNCSFVYMKPWLPGDSGHVNVYCVSKFNEALTRELAGYVEDRQDGWLGWEEDEVVP
jgi:hypothetical protein